MEGKSPSSHHLWIAQLFTELGFFVSAVRYVSFHSKNVRELSSSANLDSAVRQEKR